MAIVARSPAGAGFRPSLTTSITLKPSKFIKSSISFSKFPTTIRCFSLFSPSPSPSAPLLRRFSQPLAVHRETSKSDEAQATQIEENLDDKVSEEDGASEDISDMEEVTLSALVASLESYKEASASNDESKIADIEAFVKSFEDEKIELEGKVIVLSEELSSEKDRVLRISADFDNFRKRTERERLSLVTNAQGEVMENLLPVLDNFERAKAQIKVESEGEEKINNSYQSIYKQFVEILGSLGVVPVETVRNPFDPLLHEAIMREDSGVYEEGIIIEEFCKGFKLGNRLLRPSMVKVSAGPGPATPDPTRDAPPSEEAEITIKSGEDGNPEVGSA
ncbi:GrpE nucleotide exchange factor [Dillenia turbinata]|uniref:GrpE protein homolog n=1 Tax=Dillenia turbinata TaxID=194707 RepID=A0AAN8W7B4_9MAGN